MAQSDGSRDYRYALEVLRSGDLGLLEELAELDESFPHGSDGFIGRRWITNAIDSESVASVSWMLAKKVDLQFRDDEGYTPLHSALECSLASRYEMLRVLLIAGAAVNRKGVNDWTPAHMAAAGDDVEALRILVEFGADLSIRTDIDDYATPMEEARLLGSEAAFAYLKSVA